MKVQATIQTGKVFELDFDSLPDVSKAAIIHYGTQRWINDRTNSTKRAKALDTVEAVNEAGAYFVECLTTGKLGAQRSAVTRDPRLEVVVDLVVAAKGVTKKAVRAAIKDQGLDKFVAALGEKTVSKEMDKRAKLAEQVSDDATAALDALDI